jgi:hypothetical protein
VIDWVEADNGPPGLLREAARAEKHHQAWMVEIAEGRRPTLDGVGGIPQLNQAKLLFAHLRGQGKINVFRVTFDAIEAQYDEEILQNAGGAIDWFQTMIWANLPEDNQEILKKTLHMINHVFNSDHYQITQENAQISSALTLLAPPTMDRWGLDAFKEIAVSSWFNGVALDFYRKYLQVEHDAEMEAAAKDPEDTRTRGQGKYSSTGEEGTPQEHTDGTVKYTYIEVQPADDSADLGDFGLCVEEEVTLLRMASDAMISQNLRIERKIAAIARQGDELKQMIEANTCQIGDLKEMVQNAIDCIMRAKSTTAAAVADV